MQPIWYSVRGTADRDSVLAWDDDCSSSNLRVHAGLQQRRAVAAVHVAVNGWSREQEGAADADGLQGVLNARHSLDACTQRSQQQREVRKRHLPEGQVSNHQLKLEFDAASVVKAGPTPRSNGRI